MLLLLAMPAGVGVLSSDPAWFTGLVMTSSRNDFRARQLPRRADWVWRFYLANVGLVLMGRAMRHLRR
jgi:hypothetical protein